MQTYCYHLSLGWWLRTCRRQQLGVLIFFVSKLAFLHCEDDPNCRNFWQWLNHKFERVVPFLWVFLGPNDSCPHAVVIKIKQDPPVVSENCVLPVQDCHQPRQSPMRQTYGPTYCLDYQLPHLKSWRLRFLGKLFTYTQSSDFLGRYR